MKPFICSHRREEVESLCNPNASTSSRRWLRSGIFAALLALASVQANAAETASVDPYANETPAERDARMKWWREARFGMFIHWGVYAVPAGTYKGQQIQGIGEWIMLRGKIPVAEYREYARNFNPVKYDPDAWVRLAKAAGMKYIIITSKHHDGFALFDSKASDWNVVKATPYGKDLLKPLAEACRRHGLKLGFYYSQAQDWTNLGGAASRTGPWDDAQKGSMDDYIRNVAAPQVKEILSNYGDIAVLWWDTPVNMNKERAEMLLPLIRLQPGIIHNNRLGGGYRGDTDTPEQRIPATGIPGRDWETCMTMNRTWGFKSYDHDWKSTETLIRNLIDIASKGGNYLLNVGPTAEGEIPEPSVQRLEEIGQWMKQNGHAIYGTTASPFPRLPWGRCTKKVTKDGTTLYLHVFNWPTNGQLVVPGLQNEVARAWYMSRNLSKRLTAKSDGQNVIINVPKEPLNRISSTIMLQVKGPLKVEATPLTQDAEGSVTLVSGDARYRDPIRRVASGLEEYLGAWTNASDSIEWTFRATRPGKLMVSAHLAAEKESALEVMVGGEALIEKVPATGGATRFRTVNLGTVEIAKPGDVTVRLRGVPTDWTPVNLEWVKLAPAK